MPKIWNYGASPQNCYIALKNALGMPPGVSGSFWAEVPTSAGERTPSAILVASRDLRQPFQCPEAEVHQYDDRG